MFIVHGFTNSRGHPKTKNTSFVPFNGQQHQNCLAIQAGLQVIPNDVQEIKENRGRSHDSVSGKKGKALTKY